MDSLSMLRAALLLLVLAALGGLLMAGIRFSRKVNPPAWIAMLHGLLAASAITLVAYADYAGEVPTTARVALALFVAAALGGVVLSLGYKWKQRLLPAGLVVGHALLAVSGVVCLWMAAYPA